MSFMVVIIDSSKSQNKYKFGEFTFGKFFCKFVGRCIPTIVLSRNLITFNRFERERINDIFDKITYNFLKFNLYIKNFNYLI